MINHLVFSTVKNENYFFGYYDKSPLNYDSTCLLAQRASFNNRSPNEDDVLEIGYINWQVSNKFNFITNTRAWNWQQGCMLQWLNKGKNRNIIYNDRIDGKFVSIICNIDTLQKTTLPMAYYALSGSNYFVLCIDFERHYWFRQGYNYQGIENHDKRINVDRKDGIWRVNIMNQQVEQIITLERLLAIKPLSNMENAIHYLEHLMISPNDKRFCFLHRWKLSDGSIYARFYTANVDGSNIFLLNDSGRMSHFCWRNNEELIGWGGIENPVNRLRKYKNIVKYFIGPLLPLYKLLSKLSMRKGTNILTHLVTNDSYILFRDLSNKKSKVLLNVLNQDGHPSFFRGRPDLMVTDTYPDPQCDYKEGLYLYDFKKGNIIKLAEIPHGENFANQTFRCDLHPKISFDNQYVCVDTLEDGYRSIRIYVVGDLA